MDTNLAHSARKEKQSEMSYFVCSHTALTSSTFRRLTHANSPWRLYHSLLNKSWNVMNTQFEGSAPLPRLCSLAALWGRRATVLTCDPLSVSKRGKKKPSWRKKKQNNNNGLLFCLTKRQLQGVVMEEKEVSDATFPPLPVLTLLSPPGLKRQGWGREESSELLRIMQPKSGCSWGPTFRAFLAFWDF